jgi:hypothetical protein
MIGDQIWDLVRHLCPEEFEMDWRGATVAGAGLVMQPFFRRIAPAEQMIKMTMMDLILAHICHISDLIPQIRFDPQIAQSGFLLCFPEDGNFEFFILQNRSGWHLDPGFREINMAENEEPIPVRDVGKDFVNHGRHESPRATDETHLTHRDTKAIRVEARSTGAV